MVYSDGQDGADAEDEQPSARTAFREAEKKYQLHRERKFKKTKNGKVRAGKMVVRPVDLSEVLDLAPLLQHPGWQQQQQQQQQQDQEQEDQQRQEPYKEQQAREQPQQGQHGQGGEQGQQAVPAGLQQHTVAGYSGPVFTFDRHPGLVYLPGALPPTQQLQLIHAALADYPQPPARTNHSRQYGPLPGLWQAARADLRLNWQRRDEPRSEPVRTGRVCCAAPKPHRYAPGPPAGSQEAQQGRMHSAMQGAQAVAETGTVSCQGGTGSNCSAVAGEHGRAGEGEGEGRSRTGAARGHGSRCGAAGQAELETNGCGSGSEDGGPGERRCGSSSSGRSSASGELEEERREAAAARERQEVGAGAGAGVGGGGCEATPSFQECWSVDGVGPPARQLLHKLRWATLGPQFNWTERQYDFSVQYRPLPATLASLARQMAAAVDSLQAAGLQVLPQGSSRSHYEPDAAIINYYQEGDVLGGHLDDVERDMAQPIVSVSLGCDAVFLMGGHTRHVPPSALRLRSGDVLVLAGPARACYHGVPRILQATADLARAVEPAASAQSRTWDADELAACLQYATTARVNISVRAVA